MDEPQREHKPVLVEPVLRLIAPDPGETILDGTVGLGGHAAVLIPRILPGGRYFGLDLDETMISVARSRLSEPAGGALELFCANYADFPDVLQRAGLPAVDHMLLDLGVNSAQLADAARGFSFDRDGPLDMRYDRQAQTKAIDLVNSLSERELADVIFEYGQDTLSRKIARRICQVRHSGRITTTLALARAVETAATAAGERRGGGGLHPATRVFQALRVAVNRELDNLRRFLDQAPRYLRPGGKLAVISFHSLEDGIVKQAMRTWKAAGRMEELTRRPVIADAHERGSNPRSRSAKLRVARCLETR